MARYCGWRGPSLYRKLVGLAVSSRHIASAARTSPARQALPASRRQARPRLDRRVDCGARVELDRRARAIDSCSLSLTSLVVGDQLALAHRRDRARPGTSRPCARPLRGRRAVLRAWPAARRWRGRPYWTAARHALENTSISVLAISADFSGSSVDRADRHDECLAAALDRAGSRPDCRPPAHGGGRRVPPAPLPLDSKARRPEKMLPMPPASRR